MTPFTLTPAQIARLSTMRPVEFDLELQRLAQSHHYAAFPVLGVFDSLMDRPQMQDWFANQDRYLAEARGVFEAGLVSERRAAA